MLMSKTSQATIQPIGLLRFIECPRRDKLQCDHGVLTTLGRARDDPSTNLPCHQDSAVCGQPADKPGTGGSGHRRYADSQQSGRVSRHNRTVGNARHSTATKGASTAVSFRSASTKSTAGSGARQCTRLRPHSCSPIPTAKAASGNAAGTASTGAANANTKTRAAVASTNANDNLCINHISQRQNQPTFSGPTQPTNGSKPDHTSSQPINQQPTQSNGHHPTSSHSIFLHLFIFPLFVYLSVVVDSRCRAGLAYATSLMALLIVIASRIPPRHSEALRLRGLAA